MTRSAAASDSGCVREHNEDAYLVDDELGLFIVADGMGGHVGGQMASRIAVDTVHGTVRAQRAAIQAGARAAVLASCGVPRILADAIRAASAAVYRAAQQQPELSGMGTTCTAVVVQSERAFIGHVGDSRCYVQRDERIVQVTDDHSLVSEQIKAGLLTADAARASRLKNIITRSVGFERDVSVDTFAIPTADGDRLLICSDGLTNRVEDVEIGKILAQADVTKVPAMLIRLANDRGGDDNITVVCAAIEAAA